jgi:hypothetical protein
VPITTKRVYSLTGGNLTQVPEAPGVYALYRVRELIYYGSSEDSIRSCLQGHVRRDGAPCTRGADRFAFELHSDPNRRKESLLAEFKDQNGHHPECNVPPNGE